MAAVNSPEAKVVEALKELKRGEILTMPFLNVCEAILLILGNAESIFKLVKVDIHGNISRLKKEYSTDTAKFRQLQSFVQVEVAKKTAKDASSCTHGLLWLTRNVDFVVQYLNNLVLHQDWPLNEVYSESYSNTLGKWHGPYARSTYLMAKRVLPGKSCSFSENLIADMRELCETISPFLDEIHGILVTAGVDDIKSC